MAEIQKYNCVEEDLHSLNRQYISIDQNTRKKYNKYLKKFVDTLIEDLSKDELFATIFVDKHYSGSYFNRLKVGKPDEFDLNLVMKIPCIDYKKLIIKAHKNWPGYVTLRITPTDYKHLCRSSLSEIGSHPMKNWFNKDRYFLPNKFRRWLQSVIDKHYVDLCNENIEIEVKTSGPAVTLCVTGKVSFNLDLVPVIQINEPQWPPSPPFRPLPKECRKNDKRLRCWYLIPKPLKYGHNLQANFDQMPYWRLSFYQQERVLMKGKNKLKPAIKLVKKLKMTQGFAKISSYHINMIALWELENRRNDKMWNSAPLGFVFVYLLKKLHNYLYDHWIPYYWNENNNLLATVEETKIMDYYTKLREIIRDIEQNPKLIPFYICKHLSNKNPKRRNRLRRLF